MSPLEFQFRSKMSKISSYTSTDLLLLPNPRMRYLFKGATSASNDEAVVAAFVALYEDMKVLRVGGDMILGYLVKQAERSRGRVEERKRAVEGRVGRAVGDDELAAGMGVFDDIDLNKDGEITKEELEERGEGVLEVFGEDFDVDGFIERHSDKKRRGGRRIFKSSSSSSSSFSSDSLSSSPSDMPGVAFQEFMTALITSIEESGGTVTIEEILHRNKECLIGEDGADGGGDDGECIAENDKERKFTAMLEQVKEWEEGGISAEGRAGVILNGCFAGLKNEEVVGALRIVYEDYSALRLAGDLIFKLLKVAVKRGGVRG